jgi:hypothetical protein
MSSRKRATYWYLHPLNADTNEYVARSLNCDDALVGALVTMKDGTESHRDLWRCPEYSFVARMQRDRITQNYIDFRVFKQEGGGKIREWKFLPRRTRRSMEAESRLARAPELRP